MSNTKSWVQDPKTLTQNDFTTTENPWEKNQHHLSEDKNMIM